MRLRAGETYDEAVRRARFKRVRWAWKLCAQANLTANFLKYTVKKNGRGYYCLVVMTPEERQRAQTEFNIRQLIKDVYEPAIKEAMERQSEMWNRIRTGY